MCAWVKKRNRRPRFTDNPCKRSEAPAYVIRRASSAPSYSRVPRNVKAVDESESIVERQDEKKLTSHGGFKVIADKLPTSMESPSRGIWFFDWEALRGKTYLNLWITFAFCLLVSLIVFIVIEGRSKCALKGLVIVIVIWASIRLVVYACANESKSVPVSDPSRLSERKVQDGIMQDAIEHSRSESSHLLIAVPSDNDIRQLVHDLNSDCLDKQKGAAHKIMHLTKKDPENCVRIAQADAIEPLIALILSPDPEAQEDSVTAILNLLICNKNKELIVASGAIELLVRALSMGTPTVKENAACTLLKLSKDPKNKVKIGLSGAIPPLVNLLKSRGSQGKKIALRALYLLCSENENRVRAVQAGAMRPLVEQMVDLAVERAAIVVSRLVGAAEAREALVKEGGIPVLVKMVEKGTERQKEIAVGVLLQVCEYSVEYRTEVFVAGAVPIIALAQSGANPGNQEAKKMLKLLGQSRSGDAAARTSMPSA